MRYANHTPVCPSCGGRSKVVNNSSDDQNSVIVRRRHCQDCGARFYTAQYPEQIIDPHRICWHRKRPKLREDD